MKPTADPNVIAILENYGARVDPKQLALALAELYGVDAIEPEERRARAVEYCRLPRPLGGGSRNFARGRAVTAPAVKRTRCQVSRGGLGL